MRPTGRGAALKIWMVHPRLDRRGGAENVIRDLCGSLRSRGHELGVAALRFDAGAWPADAWQGVRIETLERGRDRLVARRLRARLRARRLAGLVSGADVVVAHNFPASVWVAGCAIRARRPRRIWYCEEPSERLHGRQVFRTLVAAGDAGSEAHPWAEGGFVDYVRRLDERRPRATRLDRALDHAAVKSLDAVLANSAFIAAAVDRVYGVAATPCLPGVAPPPPAELPGDAARPYVAWVTTPRVAKNARGFLEAVRLARAVVPDLSVRALGLDAPLRARVAELGLSDTVEALDRVDDARYAGVLAGARFVAYVSIDEPFGLVPLDAMAQGRAVLASSCGGPAETVVAGESGLLVDPLDPAAMAEGIVSLWRDPSRCEALGRAGRKRWEQEFTLDAFTERFEARLEDVVR